MNIACRREPVFKVMTSAYEVNQSGGIELTVEALPELELKQAAIELLVEMLQRIEQGNSNTNLE